MHLGHSLFTRKVRWGAKHSSQNQGWETHGLQKNRRGFEHYRAIAQDRHHLHTFCQTITCAFIFVFNSMFLRQKIALVTNIDLKMSCVWCFILLFSKMISVFPSRSITLMHDGPLCKNPSKWIKVANNCSEYTLHHPQCIEIAPNHKEWQRIATNNKE